MLTFHDFVVNINNIHQLIFLWSLFNVSSYLYTQPTFQFHKHTITMSYRQTISKQSDICELPETMSFYQETEFHV